MKTFNLKNIFLGFGMLAAVGCTDLTETTYDIKKDSIKPGKMSFKPLYVLSVMGIGCVAGLCIGLASSLPTIT